MLHFTADYNTQLEAIDNNGDDPATAAEQKMALNNDLNHLGMELITKERELLTANAEISRLKTVDQNLRMLLMQSLATVEKELQLRQQAMEMHKRKAIESAQSAADLKLHLEKYHR